MTPAWSRRRRRLLIYVSAAIAVAGVCWCASVVGVGMALSSPTSATIGQAPTELANARTVEFSSSSGARLRGWWLPGAIEGGGSVVLMHGVRSSRLQMVRRAHVLSTHGFSVLLFDFQASGESSGHRITFGKLEALDAAAAVRFVRDRRPRERIGVIGVSLGGAAALLGPGPLPVDAMVLESVYPDMDAALSNRLRVKLGRLMGPMLTPLLTRSFDLLMPPVLGVTPDELRPIDHVATVGAPVLVASGTADAYTTISEARSIFDRAADPKVFWAVPGAAHVDLERYSTDEYWKVVLPFLTRYLQRDGFSIEDLRHATQKTPNAPAANSAP